MPETLSIGDPAAIDPDNKEIKEKKIIYNSASEYLSALELWPPFREAVQRRIRILQDERKDLNITEEIALSGFRQTSGGKLGKTYSAESYTDMMNQFFQEGHIMNPDLETYGSEIKKSIEEYWHQVEFFDNQTVLARATAKSEEEGRQKTTRIEENRERAHNQAALDLLGNSLNLNGTKVSDNDEIENSNEIIEPLAWTHIGRTLVHFITVANGKDTHDPYREINKTIAYRSYYTGKAKLSGED